MMQQPAPRPRWLRLPQLDAYQVALILLMVVYTIIFARLAFDLHTGMRTHKADLGQIDQAVWNSSQGRFVEQTDAGRISTRMTDHVEPILALISPVFWLWNDVRAILLAQVIFVAVGAWLLYHLALLRMDRALVAHEREHIWRWEPLRQSTRPLALALSVAWLLAPQLQSAVLTEFHAAPLAAPLVLWALLALERWRWRTFALAVVLVALVKEEMALLAFMLALWGIWRGWRQSVESGARAYWRAGATWGGALAIFALVWFYLTTFVIVPHFAEPLYGVAESTYFARYGALGNSPLDIVRSILTRPALVWEILLEPARRAYLWQLLATFGFLALLAPELLLLSLPVLLANVLSAYPAQYYGEFHYSAPIMPFVAAAAAFGLARLWGWLWRRSAGSSASFQHLPASNAGAMALMSLFTNPAAALRPLATLGLVLWILAWAGYGYWQQGRAWGGGRFDPTPITAHHGLLDRFVAQIPHDAAVTATAAVHPHLSHRQHIYQFPDGFAVQTPATWALLDVTTSTDMAPGDLRQRVEEMLASGWGVVDGADGFLLLAQGAPNTEIPAAFYTFAQVAQPSNGASATTVAVDDWARWRQTKLVVTWSGWRAENPAPRVAVLAPDGTLLYTLDSATPPALVWRPPETWLPGASMQVTTLPLHLPRAALVRATPATANDDSAMQVLYRDAHSVLRAMPAERLQQQDLGAQIASLTGEEMLQEDARFNMEEGEVALRAWRAKRAAWNGATLDLWLQWQADAWPTGYVPFVHLLRDGATIAQQDGMPRLFDAPVDDATQALTAGGGFLNDWRTLTIPAAADVTGDWRMAIGLYNPATGARATLADGADALVLTGIEVIPFVADQTCALNSAACASQPQVYR